ncbi:hypothetical protein ABH966_003176 [Lysinibacillus sp. RC46]
MTNETEKTIIEMLQELKAEMAEMKQDMNQRFEKVDKRFDKVEKNFNFLAEELGKQKTVINSPKMFEEPAKQKAEVEGQMPDEILNLKSAVKISSFENLEELWNIILAQVEQKISKPSFETWFKSTKLLSYNGSSSTVAIAAPNSFARDWLENHYSHLITGIVGALTGEDLLIEFVVQKNHDSDDFDLPARIN